MSRHLALILVKLPQTRLEKVTTSHLKSAALLQQRNSPKSLYNNCLKQEVNSEAVWPR